MSIIISDKIPGQNRDRLAVVYVRQSTLQQIEDHQESTRLQYALVERALNLGWPKEKVTVIDEDLGRSGASTANRPGFQRLVAEVGLGHVGLVLGIDVSRLARSCRDWYQLIEICALSRTFIGDSDGVYDPICYNDRLLLGLKGTLSEAELHILKARMLEGRHAKAKRGELVCPLPRGYIRRPSGEVVMDPDEEVQATIHLVFDAFERTRSVHKLLNHLAARDIRLPDRIRSGPDKGDLVWRPVSRTALTALLKNPAYTGTYCFGRCRRQTDGGAVAGSVSAQVLLRDRWPAYITWEAFEEIQRQVAENRTDHCGVPRGGALLAGRIVCGRCGRRMSVAYRDNGHGLRYVCHRLFPGQGEEYCQSLSGQALDAAVAAVVLDALSPAALEVSLQLAEDVELDRQQQHRVWTHRLERATQDADRARRHYLAVEPENRLVARTLERDWEQALAAQVAIRADYERFCARQPARLTDAEREAIRALAEDIPRLWRAETTTPADRQEILRLMMDRVVVTVIGQTERVAFTCHWAGGHQTGHGCIRPIKLLRQHSGYKNLSDRVLALSQQGQSSLRIAEILDAEGWRPPRGEHFHHRTVLALQHRLGIPIRHRKPLSKPAGRREHEFTMRELGDLIPAPASTVHGWIERGLVQTRSVAVGRRHILLVHADPVAIERLRALYVPRGREPDGHS